MGDRRWARGDRPRAFRVRGGRLAWLTPVSRPKRSHENRTGGAEILAGVTVGPRVDCRHVAAGAWFPARGTQVSQASRPPRDSTARAMPNLLTRRCRSVIVCRIWL